MPIKNKLLTGIVCFLFGLSIVFTIIDDRFLVELFTPITVFSVFLLWSAILEGLSIHKYSAAFIGIGFLFLGLGDTMRFVNHYILNADPYSDFIRFVYILPSFCFAANEVLYFRRKLIMRQREFSGLLVNSFTITSVAFIIIYKLFYNATGGIKEPIEFAYLMSIFFAVYVVIMCSISIYLVGKENFFKGPQLITVSMLVYEVMDIDYAYHQAADVNPDGNFIDLLYTFCIILMTFGMMSQVEKKYVFEFSDTKYTRKVVKTRFIITVAIIASVLFLMYAGTLNESESTKIIIVMLAYLIMTYLLYTSQLNEDQNIVLENTVREKTAELRSANSKLQEWSSTDQLTGLYNRRYADSFLQELKAVEHSEFAFIMADLNHFKPINDTYGHEMGDVVLKEFGRRMLELPQEYISFRFGGDEFLLCLRLNRETMDLTEEAERIKKLFCEPVLYETYVFNLSASIGIAVYPDDSADIDELITYADTAMYSIKNSRNKDGYVFFRRELIRYVSSNKAVRDFLTTADVNNDFILYYQPQIDVTTGKIVGVEAFPHLKGDMENLSPAKIIPLAEEMGLMSPLGIWIAEDALKRVAGWNKTYGTNISLTINLSPLQLIDDNYSKALDRLIKELDMPASILTLDIANSVIMGAATSAKESLKTFRKKGYKLSLNDFGGGDINLSYVMECGFTGIKLSRSLIAAIETESSTEQMINTIKAIASQMDIEVTAVGIESKKQADELKKLGVVIQQGYRYGRPQHTDEIESMIMR